MQWWESMCDEAGCRQRSNRRSGRCPLNARLSPFEQLSCYFFDQNGVSTMQHASGPLAVFSRTKRDDVPADNGLMHVPRVASRSFMLPAIARGLTAVASACWLLGLLSGSAAAQGYDAACQQTGADKQRLVCDIRLSASERIGAVAARDVATNRALPPPKVERYPATDDISAFLFMFDPTRGPGLSADIDAARRFLTLAKPHDRFGIAMLQPGGGDEPTIKVLSPIGSDRFSLDKQLANLVAKGVGSPLYRGSIDGIRLLKAYNADRRTLLLFASPPVVVQDPAYTLDNVISEAKAQHVVVDTFGFITKPADAMQQQPLIRLADDTHGRFKQADIATRQFSTTDLEDVLEQADNGARLGVDLIGMAPGQKLALTFTTVGAGEPHTLTYEHEVQGGDEAAGTNLVGRVALWIRNHLFISILAGLAALLLIVAVLIWALRTKPDDDLSDMISSSTQPETEVVSAGRVGINGIDLDGSGGMATLQPLRNGAPYVMRAPMVTIGRAPDNSFCLEDETVSAHHATLMRKRDGSFELTDTGSRNGVRVNGERVERKTLSADDVCEFGAAKLRFVPS
jgi:hypothetical protein